MSRKRFPQHVYGEGEEPDPRFSLANERTFLAWLRTALALYAASFALAALSIPESPLWRTAAAIVFVVLGGAATFQAWFGWAGTEKALRHHTPLPGLTFGAVMVVGVVVAITLLAIGAVA
ncbi:YidH family protein [Nocardioides sp. NPDC051685]|uniref:YidH family protein n=1 Tax=Nocardioides sp. NPDC051685 TaxID=3364334 RepID=UPI0037AD645D